MRASVLPHGEGLRRALQWLGEEGRTDPLAIEKVSVRFDLSPLEEAFLLREFARHPGSVSQVEASSD